MAELADARDLKSRGKWYPYRFDSGLRQPKSPKIWDFLFYIDIVCLNNYWMLLGIVLIEKDLHHQIIMITMSLDEKLRKYMIEFMKITVFD